jgi:hypothetical protein
MNLRRDILFAEWFQLSRDLAALGSSVLVALDPVRVGKDPAEHCQARSLAPTIGCATTAIDRTRFFKATGHQSSAQVNANDSAHHAPQHELIMSSRECRVHATTDPPFNLHTGAHRQALASC